MSAVTSTNALAKDSTLQDVADAISTMGATSVGNLSALTTTDKTSLVGAVNEVKSGLMGEVVNITTGVTLYKQGKFRMLVVFGASATEGGIIATLPAGDRPSSQFNYQSLYVESNTMKTGYLQIFDNGNVYIRAMDDTLKNNCPAYGSYCYHII